MAFIIVAAVVFQGVRAIWHMSGIRLFAFYSGTILPRATFDPLFDAEFNALLFGTSAVASRLDLAELEPKKCGCHVSVQPVVFQIRAAFPTKLDVLLSKFGLSLLLGYRQTTLKAKTIW